MACGLDRTGPSSGQHTVLRAETVAQHLAESRGPWQCVRWLGRLSEMPLGAV